MQPAQRFPIEQPEVRRRGGAGGSDSRFTAAESILSKAALSTNGEKILAVLWRRAPRSLRPGHKDPLPAYAERRSILRAMQQLAPGGQRRRADISSGAPWRNAAPWDQIRRRAGSQQRLFQASKVDCDGHQPSLPESLAAPRWFPNGISSTGCPSIKFSLKKYSRALSFPFYIANMSRRKDQSGQACNVGTTAHLLPARVHASLHPAGPRGRGASQRLNKVILPWAGASTVALIYLHCNLTFVLCSLSQCYVVHGLRAAVSWNYLFLAPIHTLHIEQPEDAVTFVVFLTFAIVAGHLTGKAAFPRQKQPGSARRGWQLCTNLPRA
jgi:hypothetical protein